MNLEDVIGTHELSAVNTTLMKGDGCLHPCLDKSKLIHGLEGLLPDTIQAEQPYQSPDDTTSIIFDGMALVNELIVHKRNIHNCKDLADFFVRAVDSKSQQYCEAYIMFDDYSIQNSFKDQTWHLRTAGRSADRGHKVEDKTHIRDFKTFLSSKETKDQLTLYLAQKSVTSCRIPVTTHTRKGVLSPNVNMVNITSTQEEADTLLILYAVAESRIGKQVHIYASDTDVLVLALRQVPKLGLHPILIVGTGEQRRQVKLKPIYDALGPEKAAALPGFHSLTGSDTTGHIHGKGKLSCFKAFLKASEDVTSALTGLGIGPMPSNTVLSGCLKFLCQLFNANLTTANALRWHMFRQLKVNQGVEKLPPTEGAMIEHILRAHLQANVWVQDLRRKPNLLDPTTLGWSQEEDGSRLPIVSKVPPAPEAVVELVRCGCGVSKCSGTCSCKSNSLPCTDLCGCRADDEKCNNKNADQENNDADEENEDLNTEHRE
jgi:hypothetical protein